MDDFNVSSLHESKNEWGARLLTILTPLILEGFRSIFDESIKLCKENNEMDKYLMTFQNFIARIPKWNSTIIENETKRIVDRSNCSYLEDLVTCVHIIQLKLLTAMRVGQKQKKININIPKLDDFIHKVYINVARKIYLNVYLYEIKVQPLQLQKNNRELETIVQECILNTVRDSIPIENILRAYMDETVEEDVVEEIKEQEIEKPDKDITKKEDEGAHIAEGEQVVVSKTQESAGRMEQQSGGSSLESSLLEQSTSSDEKSVLLKFNDMDKVLDKNNNEQIVNAPKTIERLEEISALRNMQRKMEEDEDNDKITISNEDVLLDNLDVHVIGMPSIKLDDNLLGDIEILT
jgi:hypothetical protein